MKLYVVTVITHPTGDYGMQVNLVGVFENEVAALIVKESIELKGYSAKINRVDSGKVYSYGDGGRRLESGNRDIRLAYYVE